LRSEKRVEFIRKRNMMSTLCSNALYSGCVNWNEV
jgi:hypothetical protein